MCIDIFSPIGAADCGRRKVKIITLVFVFNGGFEKLEIFLDAFLFMASLSLCAREASRANHTRHWQTDVLVIPVNLLGDRE